jgi:hypothetical protein
MYKVDLLIGNRPIAVVELAAFTPQFAELTAMSKVKAKAKKLKTKDDESSYRTMVTVRLRQHKSKRGQDSAQDAFPC